MAAGLPVLTTPTGGRGIQDMGGKTLVIREPADFVPEIERLLKSPEELAVLASRSHDLALNHFDWSITLKEFTRRVDQLTGGKTY
jgi:glycosyltransferase involved in cell wall biosynthesis